MEIEPHAGEALQTPPDIPSPTAPRLSTLQRLKSLSFYQTLFCVYVAAALFIFTFMVPPFQKADEPAHYQRSVSLTNLDFTCDKDSFGNYYFAMERTYADLPELMRYWQVWHREVDFDFNWLRTDFSRLEDGEEVRVYHWCSLPAPGYLPNTLGVLAGKPFENPLVGFYLGRAFGALFFVLAIALSLRIVPDRYRLVIYLYAALPTVLHQVSAISYDAVQLSLFPLLFAYFAKFLVEDSTIRPRHALAFMALLWWVINVRLLAYYPILLLFFVIPRQRLGRPLSRYLLVTGGFLFVTMLTTGFLDLLYVPRAGDFEPGDYAVDASGQVRYLLDRPASFLVASYNSLDRYGEYLVRGMIGFFGWIVDYGLNFVPYYVFTVIGGIVLFRAAEEDVPVLRPAQLLFLAGAILLTAASIFFALYVVWSPVGTDQVNGLQGRYFLGLLPFTALLFSQTAASLGKARLVKILLLLLAIVLIFNMFRAVELRYY